MNRTPSAVAFKAVDLRARLEGYQQQRQQAGLWRQLRHWRGTAGQRLQDAGTTLINFAGNDYLDLAHHPQVSAACANAAREWGVGSGASRLVSGGHPVHCELEEALADWLQKPRALYFATGYLANLALVSSLLERGDRVVCDRLNHASLVDSARLGRAEVRRYAHADVAAAERQLVGASGARLLLSDGVFSMDGDCAPVAALSALAQRHQALFALDDAHGLGVLGEQGRGSLAAAGVGAEAVDLLIGTAGKALGTAGAFIAGDELLIDHLQQHARSWIYTTAPPPAVAAATRCALRILRAEPERQQALQENILYYRCCLAQAGLPLSDSCSAIQPLPVGAVAPALQMAQNLEQHGLWVVAMRSPTVPAGTERLRISLSAGHARGDIDQLVDALQGLWFQMMQCADADTVREAG